MHEGQASLCGWWPYAVHLAHEGFHVLLFDSRCAGEAPCSGGAGPGAETMDVAGAVATLRAAGARQVALIGASHGGSVVLAAAATPPKGVRAVVALSADELDREVSTTPPLSARASAPFVRVPVLVATGGHDRYVDVGKTRDLVASMPTRARLLVLGGSSSHGWGLLLSRTADWSPLSRTVERFLREEL